MKTRIKVILTALHKEASEEGWVDAQHDVATDGGDMDPEELDMEDNRWDTDVDKYVDEILRIIQQEDER